MRLFDMRRAFRAQGGDHALFVHWVRNAHRQRDARTVFWRTRFVIMISQPIHRTDQRPRIGTSRRDGTGIFILASTYGKSIVLTRRIVVRCRYWQCRYIAQSTLQGRPRRLLLSDIALR